MLKVLIKICHLSFMFRMLEKMIEIARGESTDYVTKQKYPNIAQVVASYKVGKLTKDKKLCKSLFPCENGYQDTEVSQLT